VSPFVPESAAGGVVLASRSPRRRDILAGLGFCFEVDPPSEEAEADLSVDDPFALPEALARRKCDEVAPRHADRLVLAADTVVILDGAVLNKPVDDDEAASFLRRLSGRTHNVATGIALRRVRDGLDVSGVERTRVTFRRLDAREIDAYVATGEGRDKAGSYAVQGTGAGLIRRIDGCYSNVVGLPVALLLDLLRKV
jgi:septum formation protein